MSFILDALKKSERQRPPGPVPDLFTVQGPEEPRRGRGAPAALLFGAVALCVVGVGVWFWLSFGGPGAVERPAPTAPAASAPSAVPAAASPQPVSPVPDVVSRAGDAPPHIGSPEPAPRSRAAAVAVRAEDSGRRGEKPAAPAPSAAEPAAPVAAAPQSAAPVAPVAPAPPPASPVPAPPAASANGPMAAPVAVPPMPGASAPVAPAPAVPAPSAIDAAPNGADAVPAPPPEAPEVAAPSPDGRVRDLAELPPAIRSALPELAISGHVWSEEAELRILSVRDRIVREGGEAAPGVRLEEITADGAVFEFQGWRFRVGAF